MADDICFNGLPELDFDAAAHYGIPNQRKGIRRFQYQNGTYTPAGNERYRPKTGQRRDGYSRDRLDDSSREPKPSLGRRIWTRTKREPGIIAKNIVKKHIPVFALKDDELRNINERLMLEESVLHLSGRLSPRDHRNTTHSIFTSLLNVGVHTLDSAFTTAAKTAFSSHSGGSKGSDKKDDGTKQSPKEPLPNISFNSGNSNRSSTKAETYMPAGAHGVRQQYNPKTREWEDVYYSTPADDGIFAGLLDLDENLLKHTSEQLELLKSLSISDVRV